MFCKLGSFNVGGPSRGGGNIDPSFNKCNYIDVFSESLEGTKCLLLHTMYSRDTVSTFIYLVKKFYFRANHIIIFANERKRLRVNMLRKIHFSFVLTRKSQLTYYNVPLVKGVLLFFKSLCNNEQH